MLVETPRHPPEVYAQITRIYECSNQIQRANIARQLLK